jgi:predicted RNase H-like HicB family nuclease
LPSAATWVRAYSDFSWRRKKAQRVSASRAAPDFRKRKGNQMLKTFTAKYIKISSGYMGQLVEWPEVITEGKSLEECRELLQDAVEEMIAAYRQQHKEIPLGGPVPKRELLLGVVQ